MAKFDKAPKDPNGRHIRVYCSLLNSHAWRALGWSARALFLDMRATVGGSNNGDISATLATLKHRGWTAAATLAGALYELQAAGFLVKTRGGGVEHGSKICALYAFTDLDVFDQPKLGIRAMKATHNYRRFASAKEAQEAVKSGVDAMRADVVAKREKIASEKKSTLQKLNKDASETEAIGRFDASETEHEGPRTLQKLNARKEGAKHAETHAG